MHRKSTGRIQTKKGTVFLGVMIFLSVFPDSFFFNLFILVGGGLLDNIVVVFAIH